MNPIVASFASLSRAGAAFCLAAVVSGCASVYVDGATKEVPTAQFKKPAQLAPVQLLFDFQTKGVVNAQASALLRAKVVDHVKGSGLFASVSDQPSTGSGLLSITLNNVPLTDDVFARGFVTGLTFGLAGSQVSDGYVCTAKFTPLSGAPPVIKTARHAIHTTMGAAAAPGDSIKAAGMEDAAYTMTRQILSQVLNELSKDPVFNR